jgi:hypothetical protein
MHATGQTSRLRRDPASGSGSNRRTNIHARGGCTRAGDLGVPDFRVLKPGDAWTFR